MFVEILKRTKERYNYFLHAYVLMDNHFHLLIETPLGNLNKLMQNINTSYTVWINKKYRRSGHLFQGRYKAILVDKDNYLLALSRYIHLNPVKAGIAEFPKQYCWSSYKEYIYNKTTTLIDKIDTLFYFSEDLKKARIEYKKYVENNMENVKNPFEEVKAGIILGVESFIEKIKKMISDKKENKELPSVRRLYKYNSKSMEEVVDKVANFYSITQEDLRRRTRKNIRQRKLVIYLTKTICQKSNTEIGKYFGISTQAVTNVLREIEDQYSKSRILKKELENIKCIM
jgi:putative transposase